MSERGGRNRQFRSRGKRGRKSFRNPSNFGEGSDHNNKYTLFLSQEKLSENEVGITEYINDSEGFSAVFKARYSDFHVNEIDTSDKIAKLTDTSIPNNFCLENQECSEEYPENIGVISRETWNEIKELITSSEEGKVVTIDATTISKEDRTKIHRSVNAAFGKNIIANSNTVDDKRVMTFKKYVKGAETDKRTKWPQNIGEYVHFLVYKEATGTVDASFKLAHFLRIKSNSFMYAGVKDKRAKTTQWFCVRKANPYKLINNTKFLRDIHIGNITFKDAPLKLGQLNGNKFRIALRNVTVEDSLIDTMMESFKITGFINYYGLQRFGNDKTIPTYEIGIKLLQGKWKEACDLILQPRKWEDPTSDISQAKRIYQDTKNCDLAAKTFTRYYDKCIESKLLLGFVKNAKEDYVNALENIPRNMRLLYIHAFQSLVWNKIVSRRIKEFGLKPIKGDIVLVEEKYEYLEDDDEVKKNQCVKILSEDDLKDYSIFDVVLPLPGYDVKYPDNDVQNWYKDILEEHGLTLEMPKQKVKTYTLSGSYRNIIQRARNLSWKTMKYNHPNDTLIRSDYEELKGDEEPQDNPDGQYKALILNFCLDPSCYATMVLREILKIDTCTTSNARLNVYHSENKVETVIPKQDSLLSDATKYEEFKQQIFGIQNEPVKRKVIEDNNDDTSKKIKKSEDDEESNIKMQPSLV